MSVGHRSPTPHGSHSIVHQGQALRHSTHPHALPAALGSLLAGRQRRHAAHIGLSKWAHSLDATTARFGLLPQAAKNYLRLAAIKRDAIAIGVEKIDAADSGGYVVFGEDTKTDPVALVNLVQNEGDTYRLTGAHRLQFRLDLSDEDQRFSHVERLLETVAAKDIESVEEAC